MDPKQTTTLQTLLSTLLSASDGSGRIRSTEFLVKPPRKYKDYYEIITEPMDLQDIQGRLKKGGFTTPGEFYRDLELVFLNAKYYNEENSQLYKDAHYLQELASSLFSLQVRLGTLPPPTPSKPTPSSSSSSKPPIPTSASPAPAQSTSPPSARPSMFAPMGVAGPKKRGRPPKNPGYPFAASPVPLPVQASGSVVKEERKQEQGVGGNGVHPGIAALLGLNPTNSPSRTSYPPPPRPGPSPSKDPQSHRDRPPPEFLPFSILQTLPLPALNESKDLELIEKEERIRAALDRELVEWAGAVEDLGLGEEVVGPVSEGDGKGAVLQVTRGTGGVRGSGWWGDERGGEEGWEGKAGGVMRVLGEYEDDSGLRIAGELERMPEKSSGIEFLSFTHPLSFKLISKKLAQGEYKTQRAFDMELTRLFEKARKWHAAGGEGYGRCLVLQRLYHALTSSHEPPSPTHPTPAPNARGFAYLPLGPGNARNLPDTGKPNLETGQVTSLRVSGRERGWVGEGRWKGLGVRVGDYVHLMNPDDPARPIIGQVFKTYVPTRGAVRHMLTVCWYYRVEQTIHSADRAFHANEVFKSGQFVDHPIEDVLEKIAVQFNTKYVRGRPVAGEWFPGWPLYICVSRYNDRDYTSVKIKNWNSCIPEEVRRTISSPVVPFEGAPHTLRLYPSPFLLNPRSALGRGATGGIWRRVEVEVKEGGEEGGEGSGEEEDEGEVVVASAAGGGGGEKRVRVRVRDREKERERERERRRERKEAELGVGSARGADMGRTGSGGGGSGYASSSTQQPQPSAQYPKFVPQVQTGRPDRSIASKFGGLERMKVAAEVEVLPDSMVKLLEKDDQGRVLWFSGPPIDVLQPEQPSHSFAYLAYLAKRKAEAEAGVDGEGGGRKRRKGGEDEMREMAREFLRE